MKFRLYFPILIASLLGSPLHILAQAKSVPGILGTVIDLSGQPIIGATLQLKAKGLSTISDAAGTFQLANRPYSPKRLDALFQVEDGKVAFHVLTLRAHVRLTVLDFAGHPIARVLDETLVRGLYGVTPLVGLGHLLKQGLYGIRLEIGSQSFYHRVAFNGKIDGTSGLRPVKVPLDLIAKAANTDIDTLVISKPGYRTTQQVVLMLEDTLPSIVLMPDSLTSWRTDDAPYLKSKDASVTITPLITVGESVPLTGNSLQGFRMGGIPDGLGLTIRDNKTVRLLINHEITSTDSTHALVSGSARRGAYVSEYILEKATGRILSGGFAFETAFDLSGIPNTSGVFSRFCSGFMAGPAQGVSVPIYLTGEESPDSLAFSKEGPQAIAILDNKARILSDFGKMAFENIVVVPTKDSNLTVAFALEDGPARESQLYMYVGKKLRDLRAPDPIYENGLGGGKLYVFATSGKRDEGDFNQGSIQGRWVDPIKNRPDAPRSVGEVSAKTLQSWSAVSSDAKDSSFNFDRIEDGTYDRDLKGVFYFVTTGAPGATRNRFGRIYKLTFDPADPVGGKPPVLEIFTQGDSAKGFVSPDNIDIGPPGKMVVLEDFNLPMHRPPAVWMLDMKTKGLKKLAEIDVSAVPAASRPNENTLWETTGIIDASVQLGKGAWLLNVQAHSVGSAEAGALQGVPQGRSLVQGGQLLLLRVSK